MYRDKYYFISDIHLGINRPSVNNKQQESILIDFLEEIKSDAKELYIVGDLFDCWIEYKYVVPKGFYRFLTKLSELADQGIKIYYLSGNHDFWRGNYFEDEMGICIEHKEFDKVIDGKKFFVHHGDGFAYRDTGYKILRKILRNRVSQFLYSLLHPDVGIWLAKSTSSKSREYTGKKDYSVRDGMRDFALSKIEEGYDYVILGHRHFPFEMKNDKGTYINLGDWIHSYTYLEYKNGNHELKRFFDFKNNKYLPKDNRKI